MKCIYDITFNWISIFNIVCKNWVIKISLSRIKTCFMNTIIIPCYTFNHSIGWYNTKRNLSLLLHKTKKVSIQTLCQWKQRRKDKNMFLINCFIGSPFTSPLTSRPKLLIKLLETSCHYKVTRFDNKNSTMILENIFFLFSFLLTQSQIDRYRIKEHTFFNIAISKYNKKKSNSFGLL